MYDSKNVAYTVEVAYKLMSRALELPSKFTQEEYNEIHSIVFSGNYSGYTPNIIESPNGDGNLDDQKRYAHIAMKYLDEEELGDDFLILLQYLVRGYHVAMDVARALNIDEKWYPKFDRCALRILEYPPGAIAHPHTDFDLFTLIMYRDYPEYFRYVDSEPPQEIQNISSQVHYGELLEVLGYGEATKHEVIASDTTQGSIVFFVIPDWELELPTGETVGDWLQERLSRSRY